MFAHLKDKHINTFRGLIEAYASSISLATGWRQFTGFLWEHAVIDPDWALRVVDKVIENPSQPSGFQHFAGGENLIRLVINVYTDPTSGDSVRRHAMDIFDTLMEANAYEAHIVLEEWDRR